MKWIMSWLKKLFGCSEKDENEVRGRKRVTCGELSQVLNFEPKREANGGYIGHGTFLDGHVEWSTGNGHDNKRGGFDVVSVKVKNLDIELDSEGDNFVHTDGLASGDVEIKYGRGLSGMKMDSMDLHFENCRFDSVDIWATGVKFVPEFNDLFEDPYLVNYSFRGKTFTFRKCGDNVSGDMTEGCSFSFPGNSQVEFTENGFKYIAVRKNEDEDRKSMDFSFVGNEFEKLDLDFCFPLVHQVTCFFHDNRIGVLNWDEMVTRRKFNNEYKHARYDDVQEYNLLQIEFGNDRIEKGNKELFVRLKKLAIERKDALQEKIIDHHISMIRYVDLTCIPWGKIENHEKEELLVLRWRWYSSHFYMSWVRPLGLLVVGYFVLNLIPMLWVDGYDCWWEWLELSVSSPKAISDLAESLGEVLGTGVTGRDKFGLRVVEWFRWIWIALCVIAFRNAIRKK